MSRATMTRAKKPDLPLKWHGGKCYLAARIVERFPPHTHYVEPFCGGCAVLLAHPSGGAGRSELVNDVDGRLTNFWRVLRDPETFAALARRLEATPLSRVEWEEAGRRLEAPDPVQQAAAFFVRCRQSLAGRMKSFTAPTRTRLRRGINGNVSEWLGAVDGLAGVHARLRRVFVENMDALRLIEREDTPGTLFYCDPPYMPDSRTAPDVYAHEMTPEQHEALLRVLLRCEGKVFLSGYRTDLYDSMLAGWTRHEFDLPNNSGHGETKGRRVECLWESPRRSGS